MQLCLWFRPWLQWGVHSRTRMPWTSSRMSKGKFFIEKNHKLWRINYDSLFMNDQWLIIKRVNTILNVSSAQNQVAMRKRSVQKIQTKMPLQFNAEKEQVSNAKIGHRPIQKWNVFRCWKLFSETLNSYFPFFNACILKLDKRAPMEWISWSKRIHFPLWLWWPKYNCPYGRNSQLRPLR